MFRFLLLFLSCITVSLSNTLCYGTSDNDAYNNDNGTCSLQSPHDFCFFAIDNYRTVIRGCTHRHPDDIGHLICPNTWTHDLNNHSLHCCQENYCNDCPDIEGLCTQLTSPLNITNPPPGCTTLTCPSSSSVSMTSTPGISLSPIPSSSVIMSSTSVPTPIGLSQTYIIFISATIILFIITI